jgi:uncharacterized membrane protein
MATTTNSTYSPHGTQESIDTLTGRNLQAILHKEQLTQSGNTRGQRFAACVAEFCGTMTFVWIHVVIFTLWIAYNTSPWVAVHPDPLPFSFLNITISIEAIFLSAFILISQNQEARVDKQRSHLDLQINLLTEQGTTQMLKMLRSIADKVGADFEEGPDMALMEQATRPERLLDQINAATQQEKNAAS